MADLGHNIDKARIAELRRQRRAALGKASRAYTTMTELRWKAQSETSIANRLADEIESLGGKVRR
jgi:hypothetical protein